MKISVVLLAVSTCLLFTLWENEGIWFSLATVAAFIFFTLSLSALIFYAFLKRLTRVWFILTAVCFSVLGAEFVLRIGTSKYMNYFEVLHGRYASYYGIYTEPVLQYKANDSLRISSPGEFDYVFTTNQMGYADREWAADSSADSYKILCMGDSFTLGVGAPQDSGWVAFFSHYLTSQGIHVQTFNSGITGSDIVNELHKLKTLFNERELDAVVLCLNVSDLVEIYLRGGEERFSQRSSPAQNPLQKTEWLYRLSFLYRLYIHEFCDLNFLFLSKEEVEMADAKAIRIMREHILNFQQYCLKNDILFYFFIHPHSFEMLDRQYMSPIFSTLLLDFEEIGDDFMNEMSQVISQAQDVSAFYYERDRHFTARGYKILGELAANGFAKRLKHATH